MQRRITRIFSPFLSQGAYFIFSLSEVLRFFEYVLFLVILTPISSIHLSSHFNIVRRALITTVLMEQMSPRFSWSRCCYFSLQVLVFLFLRFSFSDILISSGIDVSLILHTFPFFPFYNHIVWFYCFEDMVTLHVKVTLHLILIRSYDTDWLVFMLLFCSIHFVLSTQFPVLILSLRNFTTLAHQVTYILTILIIHSA